MRIVHVTYTTKAEYAAQNMENIKAVMTELQALNNSGINYSACVCTDGKTFIHYAFMASEADSATLNALPSFKHFQEQLKASGPEVPPKAETLTLVGSSQPVIH